mgnify:CR=1 FL=1
MKNKIMLNYRTSHPNNQTFAASHSKTNSTIPVEFLDSGLGPALSMTAIPIDEIDEKIKIIENEYNTIITKEINLR